jgi:hypothetical protein
MKTCQRSNDWWNCKRQSCINHIYLFKQKFKPISYFRKKCKDLATNPVIFWRLYRCTAYTSDGRKEKDYVLDFKGIAIV